MTRAVPITQSEYLAAWKAQVAIGKAMYPEIYGVWMAPDWNPPVKVRRVSVASAQRRRISHSRKRPE